MARTVNQTLAWFSSIFISLAVFGVGYGLFSLLAHAEADADGHEAAASHESSDHDAEGQAIEAEAHGDSYEPAQAEEKSEGHGSKASAEDDPQVKAEAPASELRARKHAPAEDDPRASGHEEEEISAEQFKHKDEHH